MRREVPWNVDEAKLVLFLNFRQYSAASPQSIDETAEGSCAANSKSFPLAAEGGEYPLGA